MTVQRIVHVSLGTNVGGMEKLLVEFARLTDRDRYALTFISLQERGELAAQIESHDWPVIAFDKSDGLKPALIGRLAKQLRSVAPEILHTHNTAGFVYGVAAGVIAGVPKIIHTRHGQRFESSARQTRMFRLMSRWVDRVVTVSSDARRLTIEEGIEAEKTVAIRNGVDLNRFSMPTNRSLGRIAVVARLSPEKDIASLVHAVKIMAQQSVSPHLDVIGDGSERESLQSLVTTFGLNDQVHFHGIRDDIPAVLADASIFVLPSLTEGISLTLLEAMASGLPVVACNVGGNPEVVQDGESGFLVPPGDPSALAGAILKLHHDNELAAKLGLAGRRRVEQQFCIHRMISSYEKLYRGDAA